MKDYFGYKGKTCVVVGGASGMGRAAVETLVDMEAVVYVLDVKECDVPGIKEFVPVNLANRDSIDEAFAKLPNVIDKYFNFAGVGGISTDVPTTITINYIAPYYILTKYCKERIPENGAIVVVTAMAGTCWEQPQVKAEIEDLVKAEGWDEKYRVLCDEVAPKLDSHTAYRYSKRALEYQLNLLVTEFAKMHIRLNSVKPGATNSGLTKEFSTYHGSVEAFAKKFGGYIGRLAESREMGEPAVFLGSDMASFISGAALPVEYANSNVMYTGEAPNAWATTFFDNNDSI